MSGSKTNTLTTEQVKKALARQSPKDDFVWDGRDDDERPASADELAAGIAAYRQRKVGRPRKRNPKVQVTIRYSPEVLRHFRATGKGWQTRMDEALKQWIAEHGSD